MSSSEGPAPIDVRSVVAASVAALPLFLGREPVGVRIEEVMPPGYLSAGEWRVTISHLEPGVEAPEHPVFKALAPSLGALRSPPPPERVLRVIVVDAETGRPIAMRLREPR